MPFVNKKEKVSTMTMIELREKDLFAAEIDCKEQSDLNFQKWRNYNMLAGGWNRVPFPTKI